MRNLAIARRYAKALLLIGKDDGQIETYRKELQQVNELLERNSDLDQAINNFLMTIQLAQHQSCVVAISGILGFQGLNQRLYHRFHLLIFMNILQSFCCAFPNIFISIPQRFLN